MKVMIVKELMTGDVSPVAMFRLVDILTLFTLEDFRLNNLTGYDSHRVLLLF